VQHLDGQEDALRAGRQPDAADFGAEAPDRWGRLLHGDTGEPVQSEPGRWLTFYEGVERALRTGAPPPVLAEDALAALEVLDDARHAAERAG
jgi:predicted dehydrogenase